MTLSNGFRQREVVLAEEINVLVLERRKPGDVFGVNASAVLFEMLDRRVHIYRVPENEHIHALFRNRRGIFFSTLNLLPRWRDLSIGCNGAAGRYGKVAYQLDRIE